MPLLTRDEEAPRLLWVMLALPAACGSDEADSLTPSAAALEELESPKGAEGFAVVEEAEHLQSDLDNPLLGRLPPATAAPAAVKLRLVPA